MIERQRMSFLRVVGQAAALLALVLSIAASSFGPVHAGLDQTTPSANPEHAPAVVVLPGSGDNFYKLPVSQTGIHAITFEMLRDAGLPVGAIDPATFRIFEQGIEISRRVIDADESDSFTAGDAILFYGRSVWTQYTSTNIYWLTFGAGDGQEMEQRSAAPDSNLPEDDTFLETLHLEQDKEWTGATPLTGLVDRWHWYWYQTSCRTTPFGRVEVTATLPITIATPGVAVGAYTATLMPRLRGFNKSDSTAIQHTARLDVNGAFIGEARFANHDEFTGSFNFDQALLAEGQNVFTLKAPCPAIDGLDLGLINWYEVKYHRTYAAPATGQFAFNVDAATPTGITLSGLTGSTIDVYDIRDPQHPQLLTGITPALTASSSLALAHTLSEPGRYIATAPGQLLTPGDIALDTPSFLRSPSEGADWIIITPPDFVSEAERLAAHRRTYQMFRTAVVQVQEIYDEFNGGLKDKEAIRAFLRHAYENWPAPAPRYVVLLGDGHYDPRYLLSTTNTTDFVPPYLAPVNPFDGIVAADNRYVAYDPVAPAKNPAPFMNLGRLPANSLADAENIVDKIIAYETAPAHGDWNRDVLFVADNTDVGGDFAAHSEGVAGGTVLPADYDRQRIYWGTNYTDLTATNNAIIAAINQGALFVNYNGHATTQDWAFTPVLLARSDQARMTNTGKYPVFLPMTCLEGDFTSPVSTLQSFGESVVRLPEAGAVASWSPTGKGLAQGHEVIFEAFYAAIFEHGITEIGPATTFAKQMLYDSTNTSKDLIDNYILFGDPAMPLDLPAPDLSVQKQASPAAPWQPGHAITYTLAYSNTGAATATGVVLTDTLPAELTGAAWTASDPAVNERLGAPYVWDLPDLIPGAAGVITVTAQVSADVPNGTVITNTARIATATYERPAHLLNNSDTVTGLAQPLYLLGGRVFTDVDFDGSFDPLDDSPLDDVPITVRDNFGVVVATTSSDAGGWWSVALPAGTYTVTAPASIDNNKTIISSPEITIGLSEGGGGSDSVDFRYGVPTGLEIEYFRAIWITNGVRVSWATRLEQIVERFDVYRTADPYASPDTGAKINPDPIMPKAPPGEGANYDIVDTGARPGTPAYYWLKVQTTDGILWMGPAAPAWKSIVRLPLVKK